MQISATLTFTEILPSTKTIASFKVPDYNSGKVGSCLLNRNLFRKDDFGVEKFLFAIYFAVGGSVFP